MVMDNLSSLYYTLANPIAVDCEVVLYDLRGHGRSEQTPSGYKLADSVADLVDLLDALELTEPVHLLGNSYGGTVALSTAIDHPDRVASLVLVEAHVTAGSWSEKMASSLEMAADGLERDKQRAALAGTDLEAVAGRKLSRMARKADALIYDTTLVEDIRTSEPLRVEDLRRISCPTLALYGEETDVADHAETIAANVPDCDLRFYDGASHSVLMERPGELCEDLRGWLGIRTREGAPT
jgi:pimeloyl-ACP methyl ester carboxylesterase